MSAIQGKFAELQGILATAQRSAAKLEAGTKCECTRSRAGLQICKKLITELKQDLLDHKKSLPTKSKAKANADPVTPPSSENDESIPAPLPLKRQDAQEPVEKKVKPKRAKSPVKKRRSPKK